MKTRPHNDRQVLEVSRRGILVGAAGLSFGFAFQLAPQAAAQSGPLTFNAFVRIAPNGTITIVSPAIEMGQGVNTSLPLIFAEELDADWSKVVIETAPVAEVYNHPVRQTQVVVGSLTIRGYWMAARTAGAQARQMLIEAAATQLGVPASELKTEPSLVVHGTSGRKLPYGEIAAAMKLPEKLPDIKPDQLKPVANFRLIGADIPRIDIAEKSTGRMIYAIDVRVPGMVYGTIARSPVRGSGPVSFNREELKGLPDIIEAVAFDHGVGIVGRTVEAVFSARSQLKAQWRAAPGSNTDSDTAMQIALDRARDPKVQGVIGRSAGDIAAAFVAAAKVHSSEYMTDYVYHAQMEPHACVASVEAQSVEVWSGTQWPTQARDEAAKATGLGKEQVKFHLMQMGGGFGRRVSVEYVIDAIMLSKAVGKPVKMLLSREDDVATGRLRPMTAQRIDVALDNAGKITGWRHRIAADTVVPYLYGKGRLEAQKGVDHIVMAGAEMPHYDISAMTAEHIYEERGIRTAAFRGIGAGHNNFAIEAVIDELARAAGKDPVDYRLMVLKDPRAKKIIEHVAGMADWKKKRDGRGLGVAFAKLGTAQTGFSVAGTVVEVSIEASTGKLAIHNLWCAVDVGLPVQPRNVIAQIEGSLLYALGSALKERVTIKGGAVEQQNFHDYELIRQSDVPPMHVEIVRSGDIPMPVGELSISGVIPAISNAVFTLTGKRLRHAPFSPDRVKAGLA
ncbi:MULTISPECIES: molybdopterin cofactor-binding domain-containing protein [unclassified Beijerinckia]|uniref:xanthine dehydrogenase family protein molybdopterin-binding subunit n=1 Tax=unclassified Beijerinckia TaxID=2638183 RepID=UPI00089758AC|nr:MULTISPECIES: molybdopterin cofactor-binding domain-containing protein [unclassified Beijerinckia]MDH7794255.1 isoquinoline 1-oxidoreductase beta subunit [Beijerinckia sp. GAS462]SEB56970.1 isoquinoline 1-oxidoreductase, beta subunit [Beijerinckia sp. 28-YEA-48]